jgi:nitrate/nitrite transport system ATP-binding protein
LNHLPRYKAIRREVITYLLGAGGKKHTIITKKLLLPEIEPEDLSVPRNLFAARRRPIRRREIKTEPIEIDS